MFQFAQPSVHVRAQSIVNAKKQFMLPGGNCNLGTIIVDVEDIIKEPVYGHLPLLSSEELVLAYIERLHEDIQDGDETTLKHHVNLILGVEIEFRHFKCKAERDLFVINEREAVVGRGEIAIRSMMQRVEDIIGKRNFLTAAAKKKPSAKELHEALAKQYERVNWASSTEPVNLNVIDTAATIEDRVLNNLRCRELIMKAETFFSSKASSFLRLYFVVIPTHVV